MTEEVSSPRPPRVLIAAAASAAVLLAAGGIAWRAANDPQPQQVAAASPDGETFTVVYPEVEPIRDGDIPNLPADDPLLDAIEIGWIPVTTPGELPIGFIPTMFFLNSKGGDVVETIDAEGNRIGYWVNTLGYVDAAVFEDEAFDWEAAIIERFDDPTMAQERIAIIEVTGGLGPVQEAEAAS